MNTKLCETCKYKGDIPAELLDLFNDMTKYYPKIYYCNLLRAIKVYNPNTPSQRFECELYDGE